jgi:hypothetical protein
MNCFYCHRSNAGEENASFGFINFGIVLAGGPSPERPGLKTVERFARFYETILDFGFYDGTREIHYGINFNEHHAEVAKPPLAPLQTEYSFCSVDCMRKWLMQMMDKLETLTTQAGPPYGFDNPEIT